jgi:hypothetical protein
LPEKKVTQESLTALDLSSGIPTYVWVMRKEKREKRKREKEKKRKREKEKKKKRKEKKGLLSIISHLPIKELLAMIIARTIPIHELFDAAQTSMRKWCRRDAQVVQTNMSVQNAIPIHELFDAAQTSMRKCVRRTLTGGW